MCRVRQAICAAVSEALTHLSTGAAVALRDEYVTGEQSCSDARARAYRGWVGPCLLPCPCVIGHYVLQAPLYRLTIWILAVLAVCLAPAKCQLDSGMPPACQRTYVASGQESFVDIADRFYPGEARASCFNMHCTSADCSGVQSWPRGPCTGSAANGSNDNGRSAWCDAVTDLSACLWDVLTSAVTGLQRSRLQTRAAPTFGTVKARRGCVCEMTYGCRYANVSWTGWNGCGECPATPAAGAAFMPEPLHAHVRVCGSLYRKPHTIVGVSSPSVQLQVVHLICSRLICR